MRDNIEKIRQQAVAEKQAAIAEANRINQETALNFNERINNLLEVASQ
jgi:hypothetical protein